MNVAGKLTVRGKLMRDEPLARHTSWRLGGPADYYFVPADLDDLQAYLAELDADAALLWVGLGSNLLVRDGGFRGHVIAPLGALKTLELQDDGLLYAECGVSCAKLARFVDRQKLAGGDFFAGIPGTIGGALAMNAGAFGGETWSHVVSVTMIDRHGTVTERTPDEFDVNYRHVGLPAAEWFVGARFRFEARAAEDESNIRQLLRKRNQSQPIGEPSCGSVFKNPPGDHAARMIEACGLKGYRLRTARVSDKHANFIISDDDTLASDVETLIETIRERVQERFGVLLEPEVRVVGEFA